MFTIQVKDESGKWSTVSSNLNEGKIRFQFVLLGIAGHEIRLLKDGKMIHNSEEILKKAKK